MPDEHFAASLSSPELAAFLSSLGGAEDVPEDMREGLSLIQAFIGASKGMPVEELKTSLAVERTKLLRGIKPGYGPPPPYEGVYAPTAQEALGQAMMNVKNIYAESGVVLPEEIHDQPDFIGFELDFMRHLTEKEAEAWAAENHEEVMRITEKERAFLDEHMLRWIPRFCDLMLQEAQLDFYRGVARLTKGFVKGEAHTTAELANGALAVKVA
jgi:TorA maturation chaperone TorD